MGEEGAEDVGPVLFGDWKFIRGGVGAEGKVDFETDPEKDTGRGGKGKGGRADVVCACLVRLGGPQPVPLPLKE